MRHLIICVLHYLPSLWTSTYTFSSPFSYYSHCHVHLNFNVTRHIIMASPVYACYDKLPPSSIYEGRKRVPFSCVVSAATYNVVFV